MDSPTGTKPWSRGSDFALSCLNLLKEKKKKKKTLQGKGRDFECFCRISRTRSSHVPSVKSSFSSKSMHSLQKVLEYRRIRQRIQSDWTAFASTHDERFLLIKYPERSEQVYPRDVWPEQSWKLQETGRLDFLGKCLAPWPRSLGFNWRRASTSLYLSNSFWRSPSSAAVGCALCRWYPYDYQYQACSAAVAFNVECSEQQQSWALWADLSARAYKGECEC